MPNDQVAHSSVLPVALNTVRDVSEASSPDS